MENGLNEVHLSSISSEVNSLKISTTPYSTSNGNASGNQTPSPAKKCRELMFIDDGTGFSSSSTPNVLKNHVSGESEQMTKIFRDCVTESSPLSPPSPPTQLEVSTFSRRLPTVVVLGYQRVVAESQAAAERMHQQQQQFLRQNNHSVDGLVTMGIETNGHFNPSCPSSADSQNNRVNCPPSEDIHSFEPLPFPTTASDNAISQSVESSQQPPLPIIDLETESSCQSATISPLCTGPMLDSRPVAEDAESIAESVYHQPPKAADRGAAYRLARRLFTLDGFKITDVAKHLCKRNDFSQLVSEEFTSFFDFTDQTIDTALRDFMIKFALSGETQDRELIVFHFSRRYLACNPGAFVSDDACHTLVCALMLLNTDLHNQNVTRKITCQEFMNNLMELNNGENGYSPDELRRLYDAFKQEPLRCPIMEVPTFNVLYGIPPVVPMPSVLTVGPGVYGIGMNHLALPNNVGFIPTPTSAAASSDLSATSVPAAAGGCVSALGPPSSPYWQTVDPSLLADWTTGNYLRSAVFTPNQGALVNPLPVGAANGTESGGDLLKLMNNINSFPDMLKDVSAMRYIQGFVMRKCVMESHGKRTSMGKRSWKLFYARLRDLTLYFYKDEETAAVATRAEDSALSYMKHVYRFQLHCQHLRYYHEQQQRLQASLASSTPSANGSSPAGDASSPTNEVSESASKVVEEKAECQEGIGEFGKEVIEVENADRSQWTLQTPSPITASSTMPATSSSPELQQNTAAFQLPPPPPPPPPEGVVCIAHGFAYAAENYVKKPNVFCLKTKNGSEFLMQVNDVKELEHWVDTINYVAGLLSVPSLPSAVGSDQAFHRPVLPSGITHLGMSAQLESHQKRILDLTRDLAELKRRRMSTPSQPNLTYLPRDAPLIKSESTEVMAAVEGEVDQQLRQPLSNQLPYIPDSVLKSLRPSSSAATLPSSTSHQLERSFSSAFSTASLGRRRKKSFNSLRGSTSSEPAAQRADFDERVAFLEYELTRYRTYACLLEAELSRLQRLSPPKTPSSPQPVSSFPVYSASPQIRGFWQVCGPGYLPEEPSGNDGSGEGWRPPLVISSLPPQAKRGYSPSRVFGNTGGVRQSRSHRMQYRHYQMHRRQQQRLYNPTPPSTPMTPHGTNNAEEETAPTVVKVESASLEHAKPPTSFYEVL